MSKYSGTAAAKIRGLTRILLSVVLVATGGGIARAAAVPNDYTATPIVLIGAVDFRPSESGNPINKHGMVAGTARVADRDRAALLSTKSGKVYVLPTLGGSESQANDVNSGGFVVGSSITRTGERHPFLWLPTNGAIIDLGTLGGSRGVATSLNDAGWIVGSADTAAGEQHAFRRNPSTGLMSDLGTFGGPYSEARSVNNNGWIVGWAYNSSGAQPFVWNPSTGTKQNIGILLGSSLGQANDINDSNIVVGYSFTASDDSNRPFIWAPGLTRPNPLPGTFAWGVANAISVDGTVVGQVNAPGGFNPRPELWLRYGRDYSELTAPAGFSSADGINRYNRIIGTTSSGVVRWDRPA
jgi:probable HAF family extracellular repeat protein